MDMSQLRDLEFRHLVALDAVATEGTFGRAADRLGYTQSAISQQIASLERIAGESAFDRPGGPRPVELTPFGEQLLIHSRRLLSQLDGIDNDLDRFRHGDIGRLAIGTFQSVSATVLPQVVGRIREHHPDLEITVYEGDHDDELDERLLNGELDISFMVGDVAPEFESRHLLDDPFVLIARPGQFSPGPFDLADLADEPMIGQRENSCQLLNEASLRSAGVDPSYVFRTNDNGTVAAMVRAGMGIAVLPLLCVEPDDPRTALHQLKPAIPARRISIGWRRGRTLSPAAQRLIEMAVEVGAELADRMYEPLVARP